jgi:hypothetical protein
MQGRAVTGEAVEKLLSGLRLGMTRRSAAAHAGMHHATFYRMLDRDATLATEVEKAEALAKGTYEATIAKASENNWTAAAWWLERRHPAEYAKRERVEMTGADGGPIDYRDVSALPDHEREALAQAIRDHLATGRQPGSPEGSPTGAAEE